MTSTPKNRKIDPVAEAGYGPGKSELYDKARFSYAPEVLSHIYKATGNKKDLKVAEIGCGTGIFTRALLAHPDWSSSVAECKCVEPNEGMLSVFKKTVTDPRVSISAGTFESNDLPDDWADLIIAATAFHWCTDFEAGVKEFLRVIKPGGFICLVWNLEDRNVAWIQQEWNLIIPYQKDTPTSSSLDKLYSWRGIFDLPLYKDNFHEAQEVTIPSTISTTSEAVIQKTLTASGTAVQPDDEKEKIKAQVKAIIEQGDGLVWLDKEKGILEVPFASPISIFQRKA